MSTTTATSSGDVTIYWPNLDRLPRGLEPVLVDTETNHRVSMRSASSYQYATRGRAAHSFTVEVAPPSSLPLDIINLYSVSHRAVGGAGSGNSLTVSFAVTREADVTIEVQTMTGRSIRALTTRAQSVTQTSMNWDYRDQAGNKIAPGVYMLRVTATDATTGTIVRKQVPVTNLQ